MKYILILLTAFSFLTTDVEAQKFGHINTQALLDTLPEYARAQEAVQIEYDQLQAILQEQEGQLLALQNEIETNKATYSQFLLEQKIKQFEADAARLQEAGQAAEQQLLVLENTLTAPIIEKIRDAIKLVGEENSFTYIFDLTGGTILYDGGEDVLPLVLAKIQEMNAAAELGE